MLYRADFQASGGEALSTDLSARASETLGAAVAIAASLDAEVAEWVMTAAQHAFTGAFQVSVLVAAVVLGIASIVALKSLPREGQAEDTS